MNRPVLRLDGVSAGYPGHQVLHDVDLTVHAGQIAMIGGRNGAGKTTLIHTLAGHLPTVGGRILLHNRDITTWPAHRRARHGIGIVPQGKRLFGSLTVAEHLALSGATSAAREQTLDLLPDLRTRLRHRPGQLSGGQQQMLAIARALAALPTILLLDEPTEGLAAPVAADVIAFLTRLAERGATVLITDHATSLPPAIVSVYHLDRGCLSRTPGPIVPAGPHPWEAPA